MHKDTIRELPKWTCPGLNRTPLAIPQKRMLSERDNQLHHMPMSVAFPNNRHRQQRRNDTNKVIQTLSSNFLGDNITSKSSQVDAL